MLADPDNARLHRMGYLHAAPWSSFNQINELDLRPQSFGTCMQIAHILNFHDCSSFNVYFYHVFGSYCFHIEDTSRLIFLFIFFWVALNLDSQPFQPETPPLDDAACIRPSKTSPNNELATLK